MSTESDRLIAERMGVSTEMNATETVRKGQRWEPCRSSGCGWWSRRDSEGNEVEHRPLDDPLADTPEGDHEFMAILRWAQGRFGETIIEWIGGKWRVRIAHPDSGFMWYSGESVNEKEARLEALAAAIKGESMKAARE